MRIPDPTHELPYFVVVTLRAAINRRRPILRTRAPLLVILVTVAAVVGLATAGAVLAADPTFDATLQGGAAEVPDGGDPNGSGTANIHFHMATREVCWDITVTNIAAATASHIHTGAAGVSGGVVVGLDTDGFTGSSVGCVIADPAADLQAIVDNPAAFYVNVHTADFPAGAVRGQLSAALPDAAMSQPASSPLVPLGIVVMLIGLAAAVRTVRVRA